MKEFRKRRNRSGIKKSTKILFILLGIVSILLTVGGVAVGMMYYDVKKTVDTTFAPVERITKNQTSEVSVTEQKPFSILLLGVDTGSLGRTYKGRSDTMMLAAVNPKNNSTTLVSLERDTYAEIVGNNTSDKINHAYAYGGPAMAMDTVQKLLSTPVNHYMTINMQGIQDIVDDVEGITVDNPFEFTYEGTLFPTGVQELSGGLALKYSRMRYDDPKGDYGRQNRQRQIVTGIAKKMLSLNSAKNYKRILKVLGSNIKTDLTFEDIKSIAINYQSAFKDIKTDQLQGTGFIQDGVSFQNVSAEEVKRIKDELTEQLADK